MISPAAGAGELPVRGGDGALPSASGRPSEDSDRLRLQDGAACADAGTAVTGMLLMYTRMNALWVHLINQSGAV